MTKKIICEVNRIFINAKKLALKEKKIVLRVLSKQNILLHIEQNRTDLYGRADFYGRADLYDRADFYDRADLYDKANLYDETRYENI